MPLTEPGSSKSNRSHSPTALLPPHAFSFLSRVLHFADQSSAMASFPKVLMLLQLREAAGTLHNSRTSMSSGNGGKSTASTINNTLQKLHTIWRVLAKRLGAKW